MNLHRSKILYKCFEEVPSSTFEKLKHQNVREGIIRSDWIAKMIDRVYCRLFSIHRWSYLCLTAETIVKVTVERDRFIDNLWPFEGNIEKVKPVLYQFPQAVREGGCRCKDNSNTHPHAIFQPLNQREGHLLSKDLRKGSLRHPK